MLSKKFFEGCLTFTLLFSPHNLPAADEGKPAPDLQAKLSGGENFSVSANSGKVIVIHFWASWCEACQKEMRTFDQYYKQHEREGLVIVGINMDSSKEREQAQKLMEAYSFKSALAQEAHYKSYGRIWRLPLTFVIDRKGILKKEGWVESHVLETEDLEKVVTPLLIAKP